MYSKILISGRLVEPADDKPRSGVTLMLSSVKNSSVVLKHATYRCVTGGNGEYSFNAAPGTYAVAVSVYGAEPERVGQIRVYSDSLPGDLNTFLMSPGEDDLTPEIIRLVDSMRIAAAASASEAKKSEVQARSLASAVDSNAQAVQRNTDLVSQNTQTVNVKAQQVASNAQTVSSNTQSVTQMRDEVSTKTTLAQAAANTSTQKASLAAGHEASSAANARIAQDAASAVQGVLIDGGECDLSSGAYPPPQTVAGKSYSTVWYVKTGGVVSGIAYDVGDVLRYTTAKGGYYFRVSAVGDAVAPLPDVWIPFNDSLRMFAGYGREVKVGDDVVARMVNFERSTTATYIDKTGVLRTAAINEPRFEKQGLLIEGQSTNLVVNSRNPSPASSAVNITKVTSPLGDVFKFSAATTNNSVKEVKFATLTAGQSVTVSFIAEKGEIDTVAVGFDGMFAVTFNLTSASIDGLIPSGSSATITPIVGSSFYKVSVTTTTTGTVTPALRLKTNGAYIANAIGEGMLIGNMQQELLPFASSYIPTNGAAVTRAADVLLLDGINMPIGPKTVAVNFTCTVNEGSRHGMTIFREDVYAVSDRQTLAITPAGALSMSEGGGVIDAIGMVISKATQVAVAVFNGPSSKLAMNGIVSKAQRVPITANNQVYQQTWRIGDNTSYSSPIYGHIRNLRIWLYQLSDPQIRGLK